jgi:hypothetical protein
MKPEMDGIMSLCKCSRPAAFLAFFNFYAWADEQTDDGFIRFLTPDMADERAGLSGFGSALEKVGWAGFSGEGCQIQKWERHNGQSSKSRSLHMAAVQRHRQKQHSLGNQSNSGAGEPDNSTERTQPAAPESQNNHHPTVEQMARYCVELGLPGADAYSVFKHWEGNGWTVSGKPVRDWKAILRAWQDKGYMPSQKADGDGGTPAPMRQAENPDVFDYHPYKYPADGPGPQREQWGAGAGQESAFQTARHAWDAFQTRRKIRSQARTIAASKQTNTPAPQP